MPEKAVITPLFVLRTNSWFVGRFPLLIVVVCLGMLAVWNIDGCSIKSGVNAWCSRRDYLYLRLHGPSNFTAHHNAPSPSSSLSSTEFNSHLISSPSPTQLPNLLANLDWDSDDPQNFNLTHSQLATLPPPTEASLSWISAKLEPNFTTNIMSGWLAPGGEPCRDSKTVQISVPGLDDQNSIELSTGEIHEFVLQAVDDNGNPHCLGGDYFEIDLSGESWKSRPTLKDLGNGSYILSLQVHPDFAGDYNLTVVLLFRHYEGLRFSPGRFVFWKDLRRLPIKFLKSSVQLPELQTCKMTDFTRDVWSGRWTRLGKNDDCKIDQDGRYRCFKPDFPCVNPWCDGSLGSLESNGWVYSTHCSFRIFSSDSAWECLQNRWIFFWGDSNHVDSIRNLLNFVLGLPDIKSVPRRFDMKFTNPTNTSQSLRITSIFNGHWNDTLNYQGLDSLQNEEFRNLLKRYFSEEAVPDTMILNSGLHDGVHWKNLRSFVKGADYAASFWNEVLESVKQRGIQVPKLFYRTTIAAGGYARSLAFNPNKMEAFNGVVLDKFKQAGILSGVIDNFDMTFPWHYDNRCNDGVHYGRAPANAKWRDGEIGHQYFVDLMLGHILLNALGAK
ncbi:hypothetical protein GIB67_028069 [Kingdonia uniflora]|uniref:Uncharacterized protein n=1 Tax=Kingdonia uniflora TaxID=39325 RepID=A0A7J7L1C9_9MAGN|nr:hypothetical protein GIB67_028069 [Kingdonia uniflora]